MKSAQRLCVFLVIVLLQFPLKAQTQFSVNGYKEFLAAHRNLTSDALLQMYSAGTFNGNIKADYASANYFDSVASKLKLTQYEKSLLGRNGFVATERLSYPSFVLAFTDIYQNDLPVFISTDAILQSVHQSYDDILRDVELQFIIPELKDMLSRLHSEFTEYAAVYKGDSLMTRSLKDADLYLTVPMELMNLGISPYYADNSAKAANIISLINAASGSGSLSLFSEAPVEYDWSQFKPRGHYDDPNAPDLARYFRTMMWFGRIEIYLIAPNAYFTETTKQSFDDIRRQITDAVIVSELCDNAGIKADYDKIEKTIELFAGNQDNVTIDNIKEIAKSISVTSADQLLDSLKVVEFQDSLRNKSYANQLILSQILYHDPMQPDSVVPASAFLLFGQRFVIDSYVMGDVVYDRISSCRLYPSSLDPMFALGNNAAGQLLKPELDQYNYSQNLAALRYLIDSYGNDFWQGSMYNMWLALLRKLNPPDDRSTLPAFMQSAGFWQEKLNTQLSSWAQLRHDNLLYAKQSYTAGILCSYPYAYVEPLPEFFEELKSYAETALNKFQELNLPDGAFKEYLTGYFNNLSGISDTLASIAREELNDTAPTDAEINFLKHVLTTVQNGNCGESPYNGWYLSLFYGGPPDADFVVADVHTTPTDCNGTPIGAVTHVGTGNINMGIFLADIPGAGITALAGPLMSYHEYRTMNYLRLTDEEWKDTYLASSLRPSWVNGYLADQKGQSLGDGLKLITSVTADPGQQIPESYIMIQTYPNPSSSFNPSVLLSFTVPAYLSNSRVELAIYDIRGRLVKKILERNLQAGKYINRWNGTDGSGVSAASGVYIVRLLVGNRQATDKIILLK